MLDRSGRELGNIIRRDANNARDPEAKELALANAIVVQKGPCGGIPAPQTQLPHLQQSCTSLHLLAQDHLVRWTIQIVYIHYTAWVRESDVFSFHSVQSFALVA